MSVPQLDDEPLPSRYCETIRRIIAEVTTTLTKNAPCEIVVLGEECEPLPEEDPGPPGARTVRLHLRVDAKTLRSREFPLGVINTANEKDVAHVRHALATLRLFFDSAQSPVTIRREGCGVRGLL